MSTRTFRRRKLRSAAITVALFASLSQVMLVEAVAKSAYDYSA